jgi:ABC-type transporter Mla subunit MlaD
MTPEERFTKIENALQAITENQARHESAIRDLIMVSRTLLDSQKETSTQIQGITGQIQGVTGQMQGMTDQFQELRDAQMRTDAEIRELRDAQKHTDEKLNALIETVDRIIKRIEIR